MGDFKAFKNIVSSLPEHFLSKLKNIYIVKGGMTIKLYQMVSQTSMNKLLSQFIIYTESYLVVNVESNKYKESIRLLSINQLRKAKLKGSPIVYKIIIWKKPLRAE